MAQPPLTAEERRLSAAALSLAAGFGLSALALLFRALPGGGTAAPLLAAALAGLAAGCLLAARAPRLRRAAFAPSLWALALAGPASLLPGGPGARVGAAAFALWLAAAFVYFRAASGVTSLAVHQDRAPEPAAPPEGAQVKLGVRPGPIKE